MLTTPRLLTTAMLALVLSFTVAHAADDAAILVGNYVIVADQTADIEKAIEMTTEKMNFVTRPIARSKLKDTNPLYRHIRIAASGTDVEITFDQRKPIRMPADGVTIKWTREDGEVFDVTLTQQNGRLSQSYKSKDGTRLNVFRWDESSQRLQLEVAVASDRLPQPLKYALVYRKE